MISNKDYCDAADDLTRLLGLSTPPIAITFSSAEDPPARLLGVQYPEPTADNRTGAVSASCMFWKMATSDTFATTADDHGNCSVGGFTHGFKKLADVAQNDDVQALLKAGWISEDAVGGIVGVSEAPKYIHYGPLRDSKNLPDIVFLRLNGKQAMLLHDALPGLRFEGKPQCHIIAIAKEHNEPAVSTGCMLSRVRTGMPNSDMTAALPGRQLDEIISRLKSARTSDEAAAAYAAEDSKRF